MHPWFAFKSADLFKSRRMWKEETDKHSIKMKCNLCIVTFRLGWKNLAVEFKTLIMSSESPKIWRLEWPGSEASWRAYRRAYNSSWLLESCPNPQLKKVWSRPSERKINPPALAFPRFPFEAPSKKIVTLFLFFHQSEKSASELQICQRELSIGLLEFNWVLSIWGSPIHLYSTLRLLRSSCFPATCKSIAFALDATSSGFLDLLLNINSFLANHIFHQKNFGMACRIFLHSWLEEEILGYRFCQFVKRFTGSSLIGIETGNPSNRNAQAFWV